MVRTLECRRESHTLAALGDTLLPKLISGELRVKDAERSAETLDAWRSSRLPNSGDHRGYHSLIVPGTAGYCASSAAAGR